MYILRVKVSSRVAVGRKDQGIEKWAYWAREEIEPASYHNYRRSSVCKVVCHRT